MSVINIHPAVSHAGTLANLLRRWWTDILFPHYMLHTTSCLGYKDVDESGIAWVVGLDSQHPRFKNDGKVGRDAGGKKWRIGCFKFHI